MFQNPSCRDGFSSRLVPFASYSLAAPALGAVSSSLLRVVRAPTYVCFMFGVLK